MNIKKLSLQPQELDNRTGRIILPKTKGELEKLSQLPLKDHKSIEPATVVSQMVKPLPVKSPFQNNKTQNVDKINSVSKTERNDFKSKYEWLRPLQIIGLVQVLIVFPLLLVIVFLIIDNSELNDKYSLLDEQLTELRINHRLREELVNRKEASEGFEKGFDTMKNQVLQLNTKVWQLEMFIYDMGLLDEGDNSEEVEMDILSGVLDY